LGINAQRGATFARPSSVRNSLPLPPLTANAWLRYEIIRRILDDLEEIQSVLEIGAGQGAMGVRLASRYTYIGLEPDRGSSAVARARLKRAGQGSILCGDLSALQPGARFDLVCAFEVLEHLEDDAGALREWRGCLHPGGWVLLSVPAFAARFGAWDRKVGHYRRYERAQMHDLLALSGFTHPAVWSYGFPLGNVLERGRNAAARLSRIGGSMAERTASSGGLLQPADWMGCLTRAATAPFRRLQWRFIQRDVGTGFVVLARAS
jgi:SAM-dependent methyltransferase